MAVIPVTAIPKAGLAFAAAGSIGFTPAGGGDRFPPGSVIIWRNLNAGALTVTVATVDTVDGDLVVADRAQTVIVASGGLGITFVPMIYPYVDPTDNLVLVTTSVQATVSGVCINT